MRRNAYDKYENIETEKWSHAKEAAMIERLRNYCAANNIPFINYSHTNTDVIDGIDVSINGVEYDIKATDKNKLSYWRRGPNDPRENGHNPLLQHPDIPYLMCNPRSGNCYVVYKQDVLEMVHMNEVGLAMFGSTAYPTGVFTGDGQIQDWILVQKLLTKPLFNIGGAEEVA